MGKAIIPLQIGNEQRIVNVDFIVYDRAVRMPSSETPGERVSVYRVFLVNRILIQQILREAILRCLPNPATPAPDSLVEAIYRSPTAASINQREAIAIKETGIVAQATGNLSV